MVTEGDVRRICLSLPEAAEKPYPGHDGHPAVLVRFEAIQVDALAELLTESWLVTAPARLAAAFEAGRAT